MTVTLSTLSFSYEKETILAQLKLKIPQGFTLLIGPTGCGKSTLLKIIAGLLPKYGGQMKGKVDLHGQTKAMMFQNAAEQFTMATPREEIIFALENLQVKAQDYQRRLTKAVAFTKISALLDQKINTMSGGQQQRVALAVLVAMDVDLFLLDEPFAGCDPQARQFLIQKLAILRDQGKSIILSDHLLTGYQPICDHLFQFQGKKIVELNSNEKNKLFEKNKQLTQQNYHFNLPQGKSCFNFKNTLIKQNRLLLKQTSLQIYQHKITLLTGPNGIGKTSLFSALTKMLSYQGQITYLDKEIKQLQARPYLRQVAQIFQHSTDQFLNVTVQDELNLSKKDCNAFFTDEKINYWLEKLALSSCLQRVVYSLSGGQQKKLQLLLMLMTKHEVLLIDEPLNGLDQKSCQLILQLLNQSQKALQQTMVIISHQLTGLAQICDYHLVFKQQQLKYVED